MRRLLPLGIALAATLVPVVTPAVARPPAAAATMTAARGSQEGYVVTSTTGTKGGDEKRACVAVSAIRLKTYPQAVGHDGSALTWRIPDRRKPAKVTATVDTDLPATNAGNRTRTLPVTLAPVTSRGKVVAWSARTTGAVGYGDLHLSLFVSWGRGCASDSATYTFRALSLPVAP